MQKPIKLLLYEKLLIAKCNHLFMHEPNTNTHTHTLIQSQAHTHTTDPNNSTTLIGLHNEHFEYTHLLKKYYPLSGIVIRQITSYVIDNDNSLRGKMRNPSDIQLPRYHPMECTQTHQCVCPHTSQTSNLFCQPNY